MVLKALSAILILALARQGGAFSTDNPGRISCRCSDEPPQPPEDFSIKKSVTSSNAIRRREMLERGLAGLSASALGMVNPSPVWSDVSDGNALPQGAAQFGRVVRAKTDLLAVQKRVELGAREMEKAEWNNIGAFLRRVYGVSEDMKAIAGGFDSAKKQRAAELVEDLKKFSKAADAPTGTQNAPEFLAYAKKLTSILDEFLDLLSDVPDEI